MFNEIKTHEITVDIVILTIKNDALQVLLVKRNNEPFKDKWAIPGGYVRMSENLDEAAIRVLKEKTNVESFDLDHTKVAAPYVRLAGKKEGVTIGREPVKLHPASGGGRCLHGPGADRLPGFHATRSSGYGRSGKRFPSRAGRPS